MIILEISYIKIKTEIQNAQKLDYVTHLNAIQGQVYNRMLKSLLS